jgi:SAM-dependent methyltransferase
MATRQPYNKTTLSCPICESHQPDDYSIVGYGSQPPGGVTHFAVLRCRRHGVEFADALPMAQGHDTAASKINLTAMYGEDPRKSSPRYVEFMDLVEAVVGSRTGGTLHDVGCGVGHLLFEARRRGWEVQGSDIVSGVKSGLDRNGINCFIGSLSNLEIPSETCDVVTSLCVLPQHLTEPTPDMVAVARILKPGGWFVLQFPDNGTFRRVGRMVSRVLGDYSISRQIMANLYGPGGHQFAFTRKNLEEYLSMFGFKEIIFQPYSGSPKCTLARFRERPILYRAAASIGVHGLRIAGEVLRIPNHSIAFARKTGRRQSNLTR